MHPFSTPLKTENRKIFWCFQGVEKGYIGNKWVKYEDTTLQTMSIKVLISWREYIFTSKWVLQE